VGKGLVLTSIALVLGGLLAVGATARGTDSGSPAPAAFRLGDGSAGCVFDGTRLACSSRSSAAGVVLDAQGRTRASRERVAWDASTPVLQWTEGWFNGVFTCKVDGTTIVCSTVDGGMLAVEAHSFGGGHAAATLP
jgi:hypothetical protein